jgi:hypothetical protein
MVWWVLALAVLTILSYLSDVGAIAFLQNLKIPGLNASLLSVLLLLCMIGILGRMLWMAKRAEKESLSQKIGELEDKIKTMQEKRGE